ADTPRRRGSAMLQPMESRCRVESRVVETSFVIERSLSFLLQPWNEIANGLDNPLWICHFQPLRFIRVGNCQARHPRAMSRLNTTYRIFNCDALARFQRAVPLP